MNLVLFVLRINTFYVVTFFNQSLHYLSFLFIKSYTSHLFKIVFSPVKENNALGREEIIPLTESTCILYIFGCLLPVALWCKKCAFSTLFTDLPGCLFCGHKLFVPAVYILCVYKCCILYTQARTFMV